MRVMLDTNIILSGLFFEGNERKLLDAIFHNEFTGVVSETTLRECASVIGRKFSRHPKEKDARRLLSLLEKSMETIEDAVAESQLQFAKTAIRHANDAPILAAALASKPDYFITGDPDFFHLTKSIPLKIVTAAQFLKNMDQT